MSRYLTVEVEICSSTNLATRERSSREVPCFDRVRDSGTRWFLVCMVLEKRFSLMISLYRALQPNAGPMALAIGAA